MRTLGAVLVVVALGCGAQVAPPDDGGVGGGGGAAAGGGGAGGGGGDASGGGAAAGGGAATGGGAGGGGEIDAGPPDPCTLPYDAGFDGGRFSLEVLSDAGLRDGGSYSYVFVHEQLEVLLRNLRPCAEVDLDFTMDRGYRSFARFRATVAGEVSTATQAPLSGSWSGADVEGPFWSMDSTQPPLNFDTTITARDQADASVQTVVPRVLVPDGVVVMPVRTTNVVGDLYLPPGPGPFPALLVFGSSEGGLAGGQLLARAFASEGIALFAIAYFGAGALPPTLERVPVETFKIAVNQLLPRSDIRGDRIGILGVSRGSEAALLAAARYPADFAAAIAVVPSGYAWPAPAVPTNPSWLLGGQPVPFVPWANAAPSSVRTDAGVDVQRQRVQYAQSVAMASPAALRAAELAAERVSGPVVLLGAADDGIWPSCELAGVAWGRLVDAGHPTAHPLDTFECYPGAGHALNPARAGVPMVPLIVRPVGPTTALDSGGTAKANAQASRRARGQVLRIIEYLKRP